MISYTKKLTLIVSLIAIVFAAITIWYFKFRTKQNTEPLKIQISYAINALNPVSSAGWQAAFVSNHIYPPLLSEEHRPKQAHFTKHVMISCVLPKSDTLDEHCKKVRISFVPIPHTDCENRPISLEDIRFEFDKILGIRPWMLPNWQRCPEDGKSVCFEGKYTSDIQRHILGIEFRFGWSKHKKTDSRIGVAPYCLTEVKKSKKGIEDGLLSPTKEFSSLPKILFFASENVQDEFHLAIFGSKSLLQKKRRNVNAHTPVAFYVLTNEPRKKYVTPWNLEESKALLNKTFLEEEVFFSQNSNIAELFPIGAALSAKQELPLSPKPLTFAIPSYLPGCEKVASQLTELWKKYGNAKAFCTDIVSFVTEHVWTPKRDWDGFIVGVTQTDPGRHTIKYDFFTDNPMSFTYQSSNTEPLYYLAGVGQSLVTVDGERVCSLKPNHNGLGDVFVTDLNFCESSWFSW